MPRAISPGPAGLKFWRAPGLSADNTVDDVVNLPAGIADSFYPWGPKRPVQDWFCSSPQYLITPVIPPDTDNLPAGVADSFYPWGPRRPVADWFRGPLPTVPVTFAADGGSYALTGGSAVTFAFGQVAAAGSYTLTGSSAALALGHVAGGGSYTLTGASSSVAITIVAATGSYTSTGGSAVTFAFGQGAAAGNYSLTGADAAFVIPGVVDYLPAGMTGGYVPWGRRFPINLRTITGRPLAVGPVTLTAAGGSYAITGSAISFVITTPADTTNLPAGVTGWFNPWRRPYPVSLRTGINPATTAAAAPFTLTAAAGSYTITGSAAALTVTANFVLTAAAGSYTLTGSSAGQALGLTANSGTYTVSGTAAVLARGFAAGAGAYAITGTEAQLRESGTITLTCGAGSYTLTGGTDVSFLGITPPTVEQPGGNYAGVVVGAGRGRMIRRRKRGELDLPPDLLPPPLEPSPPDLPPPAPGPQPPDLLPPQPGLMADMAMPQPKPLPPHVDEDEDEIALLLGLTLD